MAGLRYREGLTQQELSEKTEISRRHISEMENDRRTIGEKRAMVLAEALNAIDHKIFTYSGKVKNITWVLIGIIKGV